MGLLNSIAMPLELVNGFTMVMIFFLQRMLVNDLSYYPFVINIQEISDCWITICVWLITLIFFAHVVKNPIGQNLEIPANGYFSM